MTVAVPGFQASRLPDDYPGGHRRDVGGLDQVPPAARHRAIAVSSAPVASTAAADAVVAARCAPLRREGRATSRHARA